MTPRVLISDALSPAAVQIFKDRGIEVDFQPNLGKDKDKLAEMIGGFDGLAIRSATKVTAKILEKAKSLKVIGRAGIGVDNVDIPAATARGIIVMNTPFGNSITTAEHAITLMLALARQIPEADASTQAGKWEKNKFMGVEIFAKTLGVIGCGNIGSIVADRAIGLKMKVIAYDPFLSPERAVELGVEKVELDELWHRADFITLHTPLTDKTRNIIDADTLTLPRRACASSIARAAGWSTRRRCARRSNPAMSPAPRSTCSSRSRRRRLPVRPAQRGLHAASRRLDHRGAGERRAAGRRADGGLSAARRHLQRGQLPLDHRRGGAETQALRGAGRKARLVRRPAHRDRHQQRADRLRGRRGADEHQGADLGRGRRPAAPDAAGRQVVSAPIVAKERGIVVEETRREAEGDYESLITVTVITDRQTRSVSGTVFADGRPRIVNIKGIRMDAEFGPSMLYITNLDKPGFIGRFATLLADAGINIATFHVGREAAGGDAIALVEVDGAVPPTCSPRCADAPGAAGQAAAVLTPSLLRRDRNPAEHEPVADGVIKLELLAQQHDRQHRAEHRDKVHERRGAIGADQFDAAIEEQIAEQRRKYADIGEASRLSASNIIVRPLAISAPRAE